MLYMKNKHIVFVTLFVLFVTVSQAQRKNYNIRNGIGVFGGLTQFDIATDNFKTRQSSGWIGGFAAVVDLPHRWYTVSYIMQFSENTIGISGRELPASATSEMIDYKLMTFQAAFLFHLKIVNDNITMDAGPMIQYNGKMELKDKSQENHIIDGYSALMAGDISDITKFNINGAIGVTAGFDNFKIRAQYIYGFTNILNKLNNRDLNMEPANKSFKGNQQMIALSAMILF